MKKLQSASEQARRKAHLLGTRPDVIAKALGRTQERAKQLHLIPLIVDNQGFGVSLDVDGCRVTDSSFLLVCLGSGRLVTSAVMAPGTGRQVQNSITLYTNQADAEQKLESILGDPPTLAEFKRRIVWERSRLQTFSEAFLTVEFPTLGGLAVDQRAQAEALKAILVDD